MIEADILDRWDEYEASAARTAVRTQKTLGESRSNKSKADAKMARRMKAVLDVLDSQPMRTSEIVTLVEHDASFGELKFPYKTTYRVLEALAREGLVASGKSKSLKLWRLV